MPYDNAMAESFFATLKLEIDDDKAVESREAARWRSSSMSALLQPCPHALGAEVPVASAGGAGISRSGLYPDYLSVNAGQSTPSPLSRGALTLS